MATYFQQLAGDHFLLMMLRVFIALVLSGLIGFEREVNHHSAGFRTHILVGIGSCLMMLLSLYGFEEYNENHVVRFDPARIPSYVISGIGFLGAGTIIVYGGTIRGLTTAASIWAVAGLGLVVGIGMYATAVFTTLIILLSLIFLNNFERLFRKGRSSVLIEIVALPDLQMSNVVTLLESYDIRIKKVEIENVKNDLRNIFIKVNKDNEIDEISLFEEIANINFVKNIIKKG